MKAGRAAALSLVLAAALAGAVRAGESARIDLRVSDGRLTLKADGIPVAEALRRVAESTGCRLSITGDLGGRAGSWDIREVSLAEGVAQIARPANLLIVHGPGGADGEVREIHVIAPPGARALPAGAEPVEAGVRVAQISGLLATEDDPRARVAAIRELGRIGTEAGARVLEGTLTDADPAMVVEAIESLGRVDSDESMRLVGQVGMGTKDPEVRATAARILAASGSDNAAVLLGAMTNRAAAPGARPRAAGAARQ